MKKFMSLILIGSLLMIAGYIAAANAESLRWIGAIGWTNADNAAQTGTFTPTEMGTMTYYVRVNKATPQDNTGKSGLNRPGTWYYAGEARSGALSWPADNALAIKFQGYGWAGMPVSFTVSQAFRATDGVERDSLLSEVLAWTVPVPFVPKKAGAPGALSLD